MPFSFETYSFNLLKAARLAFARFCGALHSVMGVPKEKHLPFGFPPGLPKHVLGLTHLEPTCS